MPLPPAKETPKASAAFAEYAAIGHDRSLDRLAGILAIRYHRNKTTVQRQLQDWSRWWNWQERVIEYDRGVIEEKRKQREAAIEQMNEEHAKFGRAEFLLAIKRVKDLMDSDRFGSQATVQLMKVSSDLERLARGEAIAVIREQTSGEIHIVVERDEE